LTLIRGREGEVGLELFEDRKTVIHLKDRIQAFWNTCSTDAMKRHCKIVET